MEQWEEFYNESADTIKFRQAGGMYNDIARKAFKAGFEMATAWGVKVYSSSLKEGKTQCLSEQQK